MREVNYNEWDVQGDSLLNVQKKLHIVEKLSLLKSPQVVLG